MKYAIISSADIFSSNRWDAGFHLINKEYSEQVKSLSKKISKEDVITLLSDEKAFPNSVMKFIEPLTRGNSDKFNRDQLLKAVQEYPHLALAIIQDKGASQMREIEVDLAHQAKKIADARTRLQEIEDVVVAEDESDSDDDSEDDQDEDHSKKSEPSMSLSEITQGLNEISAEIQESLSANRFVGGVVYSDGERLHIPVETYKTAYVADCWVIEIADWRGEKMLAEMTNEGEVPVPVQFQDLGDAIGATGELPDHTQNYGRGWRHN